MKTIFDVWMGCYLATGMEGMPSYPDYIGKMESETFEEACKILCKDIPSYNSVTNTIWGCTLHQTYEDAESGWSEHRKRCRQ